MIDLLALGKGERWDQLRAAVEQALSLGCHDVAAVRHLIFAGEMVKPAAEVIDVGLLSRYERPQPVLNSYDELLGEVRP